MPWIQAGASILGGFLGSSGSKDAANAQSQAAQVAAAQSAQAAQSSNNLQKYMYDTNRTDLAPWRTTGAAAVGRLGQMLGLAPQTEYSGSNLTGDAKSQYDAITPQIAKLNAIINGPLKANMSSPGGATPLQLIPEYQSQLAQLQAQQNDIVSKYAAAQPATTAQPYSFTSSDPSYQWRLDQGQQALERSAAARGGLLGGGTLKDLTNYGQGAASQEFQNEFNRLGTVAGYGQNATNTGAQSGSQYAANVGNTLQNNASTQGNATLAAANANASGYLGQNNAWGTALGSLGSIIQKNPNLTSWIGV